MNWSIPWAQILLAAHILLVVLTVLRVLYKQHNIGTAFAWLIILFVFPLFGVIAYLLIGEPRLGQARAQRNEEMNRFYSAFAAHYLSRRHFGCRHFYIHWNTVSTPKNTQSPKLKAKKDKLCPNLPVSNLAT